MDKKQKKVAKVMREFKKKKLSIGKSDKKVKNRKQAIAIAFHWKQTGNFASAVIVQSWSDRGDLSAPARLLRASRRRHRPVAICRAAKGKVQDLKQ